MNINFELKMFDKNKLQRSEELRLEKIPSGFQLIGLCETQKLMIFLI